MRKGRWTTASQTSDNIWMTANHLKLNEDKTEFLILGTQKRISQCSKIDAKLSIGGVTIEPTGSARNIGVLFDSTLSMSGHINNTCRTAFFHLRNISKIRTHLDSDSLKSVVHALVTNKLDMYNSLYTGLPQQQINKLKRVHHAAARLITGKRKYERITPILKELHWLPLEQRINYKVLVLTYKCLNGLAPAYLAQLLQVRTHTRTLRSSVKHVLVEPFHKLHSTSRSFACTAPRLWNGIPQELQKCSSLSMFKKNLKTLLFSKSY